MAKEFSANTMLFKTNFQLILNNLVDDIWSRSESKSKLDFKFQKKRKSEKSKEKNIFREPIENTEKLIFNKYSNSLRKTSMKKK